MSERTAAAETGRAEAALILRLKAIPDGQVTATAKRAGMDVRQLLRLRRGESTDVKLSTLERLATALDVSPSSLIATPNLETVPMDAFNDAWRTIEAQGKRIQELESQLSVVSATLRELAAGLSAAASEKRKQAKRP